MTLETFGSAIVLGTFDIGSTEWLAARKLGASTIGQLACHHIGDNNEDAHGIPGWGEPFDDRWTIWRKLRGETTSESTLAMRRGNSQEAFILEESRALLGDVRPMKASLRHPEHGWATCNLDGVLWDQFGDAEGPWMRPVAVVEIKSLHPRYIYDWERTGVPLIYRAQVLWQMWITGIRRGYIVVLFHNELRSWEIQWDQEDVDLLIDIGSKFWHEHVLAGNPPAIDASTGCTGYVASRWEAKPDTRMDLNDELQALKLMHVEAKADEKDAEKRARVASNLLIAAMTEAEAKKGFMPNGDRVQIQQPRLLDYDAVIQDHPEKVEASRKAKFSMGALRADYPEVVEACTKMAFDETKFKGKFPLIAHEYSTKNGTAHIRHYAAPKKKAKK